MICQCLANPPPCILLPPTPLPKRGGNEDSTRCGSIEAAALKYAQEKGTITVRAAQRSDLTIEVAVSDDGPGIPDDEKPTVTERFYRGDASRGTEGVGLGLSLVAAVAKLHGGMLELSDNHPGLRATLLMFPASNQP